MTLHEWLETEEGEYYQQEAFKGAEDGDGYYDDIIWNYYDMHCKEK